MEDVLLYNENDELTEFIIGNLVVEINGELFTPPLSCGLLAGTFREYLLETQQIKERVILKDEIQRCTKIFLINSVRKWVEVEINKKVAPLLRRPLFNNDYKSTKAMEILTVPSPRSTP